MSLAADTREAVRARPFLLAALRAGVVNYSAAAAWLAEDAGLDGDIEAAATALRRFRDELPAYDTDDRTATVTMQSGVGMADVDTVETTDAPTLTVAGASLVPEGDGTAVVATGDVDAAALAAVLERLSAVGVTVRAAGVARGALLVVVDRRDGANAVRTVEAALDTVLSVG
ncbi:DUF7523 family protein [Halorubrum luteum]